MEGLVKRTYIVSSLLLFAGILFLCLPVSLKKTKTDKWLEEVCPTKVGHFKFEKPDAQSGYSYKLSKRAFSMLVPDASLFRIYEYDKKKFDTLVLISRKKESFHDQRVCFSAQGWTLTDNRVCMMTTPKGVHIPIMLVKMFSSSEKNKLAAFFYKGLGQYYAVPQEFKVSLMLAALKNNTLFEGVYFRFIPLYENATEEELKDFIGKYIDTAKEISGGYF